jgi:hypothetical protein
MEEKLYTYQDLAVRWKVSLTSIKRWFSKLPGLFRPTDRTVRVPESVADKFRLEKLSTNDRNKTSCKRSKKTSRPAPVKRRCKP